MGERMTGGCQCGAVRYVAEINDDAAYLCHCRMCQRATGGVSIAFKNVRHDQVTWARPPDRFRSSPIAQRGFCASCGTPLSYEADGSDRLDLTVGSFDDPYRFRPADHSGCESWHRAWLDTSALPAERTDQNERLVERWIKAVGKLPD